MIKLTNVTCGYDKTVLENANIEINPDKITFIIGKNGSGKSTLGNILTGIKKINNGKITIDNKDISKRKDIKEIRKKIGMVFQNPSNQILFTKVYEDIKFTLENINTSKEQIDLKIDEALKTVDMQNYKYDNPYNLSGGEKQRVAIASILALNPKYIIFDESTSMLDINGKKDIYKLITKLKKENIGIIFITNIMDELLYADEIIIIDNKKLFKYTKKDILDNPNILKQYNLEIPFSLKLINILNKKGIKTSNENDILRSIESL